MTRSGLVALLALAACVSPYEGIATSDYTHRAQGRCAPQIRERPDLGPQFYEVRGCSAGDVIYACDDASDEPSCHPVRPACPTAALLR